MTRVEELREDLIKTAGMWADAMTAAWNVNMSSGKADFEKSLDLLIVAVKEEMAPSVNYDIGFISYGNSTVDPKTGVTIYHDVKLIEVSQMLKKVTP